MRTTSVLVATLLAACGSVNSGSVCGDGVKDADEACDGGEHCSATCTVEAYCGDGNQDAGEACDDGNTDDTDSCTQLCEVNEAAGYRTSVTWAFSTVELANQPCPAGFDTIAVYSQLLQNDGSPTGAPVIDLFTCGDLSGTTAPLPPGRYATHFEVTNAGGTAVYAASLPDVVDVRTAEDSYDATIFTNGGYFALAWQFETQNGASRTCAQITGAESLSMLATLDSSTLAYEDIFDCDAYAGITSVMTAGTYTLSIALLNSSMQALGVAPTLTGRVIQAPNLVTDLGTITVPLD